MNVFVAYIAKSISFWHVRLGYMNVASMKRFKSLSLIPTFRIFDFDKYKVCAKAKHPKKPFNKNVSWTSNLLELSKWQQKHRKLRGKKYYITFVEECSRFTKVYEAIHKFLIHKAKVENQWDWKVKRVRINIGREYDTTLLKILWRIGNYPWIDCPL